LREYTHASHLTGDKGELLRTSVGVAAIVRPTRLTGLALDGRLLEIANLLFSYRETG